MDESAERASFEAFICANAITQEYATLVLQRSEHSGEYSTTWVAASWEGWKGRAQLAAAVADDMYKKSGNLYTSAPVAPEGYKLVPIEATWDQKMAAADVDLIDWWKTGEAMQIRECSAKAIYRAMIDAAPQPAQGERQPVAAVRNDALEEVVLLLSDQLREIPGEWLTAKEEMQLAISNVIRLQT